MTGNNQRKPAMGPEDPRLEAGRRPSLVVCAVLAMVVLLAAGWGYRVLIRRIDLALGEVTQPKRPLASLPLELGGWKGIDVPIDERELQVAWFDDDHVNRTYVNQRTESALGAFLGYVGRPRAQLGHRPDVCYAAHGWEQAMQQQLEITAVDGQRVPCLLYEFHKPDGFARPMLVLATYMINGRFFQDPDDLNHWHTRDPGLLGERPAYLTRLQLSAAASWNREKDLAALKDLLANLAGPTVELMPYWGNE